jgi:hypothetical protein
MKDFGLHRVTHEPGSPFAHEKLCGVWDVDAFKGIPGALFTQTTADAQPAAKDLADLAVLPSSRPDGELLALRPMVPGAAVDSIPR